nr:cupin domain-containing protein [Parvularcula oceani]
MPIALATALIGLIPMSQNLEEGQAMTEILREAEQDVVEGPEDYFTGKATIRANFSREDPSRVTGAIVSFEPGARTAWHSHPLGQTLIVTEGVGWTQVEGGEKLEFHEGDVLLCPRDKKHWHGATPDAAMTHIAIQEALDGTNVVWGEKVTDEEYLSAAAKTD